MTGPREQPAVLDRLLSRREMPARETPTPDVLRRPHCVHATCRPFP
jgi:hypothetical protein